MENSLHIFDACWSRCITRQNMPNSTQLTRVAISTNLLLKFRESWQINLKTGTVYMGHRMWGVPDTILLRWDLYHWYTLLFLTIFLNISGEPDFSWTRVNSYDLPASRGPKTFRKLSEARFQTVFHKKRSPLAKDKSTMTKCITQHIKQNKNSNLNRHRHLFVGSG